MPTLLGAAGLVTPQGVDGRSLAPLLEGEVSGAGTVPNEAFSLQTYNNRDAVSITTSQWKLVVPLTREYGMRPELYDRRSDSGEWTDVAAQYAVTTGYLRALTLSELERRRPDGPLIEIGDETREQLEALGYVLD